MTEQKRIYGLDILRATAIILVIIEHSFRYLTPPLIRIGDGVSIFFVLSGFLIGKLLLQKIDSPNFEIGDLWNFWIRRWMRTLPAYYFVLSIIVLIAVVQGFNFAAFDYLKFYLFIQNVSSGKNYLYPEAWSLSIEEWFYLVIPFLIYCSFKMSKSEKKHIVLFWIILFIVLGTLIRTFKVYYGSVDGYRSWDYYVRKTVVTRMDSIMFGVLAAYFNYYRYKIWNEKDVLFIVGCLLYVLAITGFYFFPFVYIKYLHLTIESVATFCVLPKLFSVKTGKGIAYRTLSFISLISYSIYLVNYAPFEMVSRLLNQKGSILFILNIVWDFGAAYLLYCFVERPFMNLRNQLSGPRNIQLKSS